jgi:hypothetical protein
MEVDQETIDEMGHVCKMIIRCIMESPGNEIMTPQIIEYVRENSTEEWRDSVRSVEFVVKSSLEMMEGEVVYRTEDGWTLKEEMQIDLKISSEIVRFDRGDISDEEASRQIEEMKNDFFEKMDESPEALLDVMERHAGDYSDDCMWIAFNRAQEKYHEKWEVMPPEWASAVRTEFCKSTEMREGGW